jgi:hypothetical protein
MDHDVADCAVRSTRYSKLNAHRNAGRLTGRAQTVPGFDVTGRGLSAAIAVAISLISPMVPLRP